MTRAQLELLRDLIRAEIALADAYEDQDEFFSNKKQLQAEADNTFERVAAVLCND